MTTTQRSSAERREITRAARDAFPPMGIYAVKDAATGTVRVRASRNVHGGMNREQFELRQGGHRDKALQAEWSRDPARFSFEVLEMVKERREPDFDYAAELRLLEQLYRAELCEAGAMTLQHCT
jgi:hypothetical protein